MRNVVIVTETERIIFVMDAVLVVIIGKNLIICWKKCSIKEKEKRKNKTKNNEQQHRNENGHSCCQKHHLERVRAMYQEGRSAFGGLFGCEGDSGQHCFMCRCAIGDARFSPSFFKVLRVIQAVEIPKMMGINIHPSILMEETADLIDK